MIPTKRKLTEILGAILKEHPPTDADNVFEAYKEFREQAKIKRLDTEDWDGIYKLGNTLDQMTDEIWKNLDQLEIPKEKKENKPILKKLLAQKLTPEDPVGFKKSGSLKFSFHSDQDFQNIADTLGISHIPQEAKGQLNRAKKEYVYNRDVISKYPRTKRIKHSFLDLQKRAKAFSESLQQFKKENDGLFVDMLVGTDPDLYNIFERCQAGTEQIASEAEEVISLLRRNTDRGGSNSKGDPKLYISDLSYIFEGLMQKKATVTFNNYNKETPYSGLFFYFVETCLGSTDPEKPFNNSSLGSLIQKVIKRERRPRRGPSIPTVD